MSRTTPGCLQINTYAKQDAIINPVIPSRSHQSLHRLVCVDPSDVTPWPFELWVADTPPWDEFDELGTPGKLPDPF